MFAFAETDFHLSVQFGFLGISAWNILSQVGSVLNGLFLGEAGELSGQGWICMSLTENSWVGLLSWFLTHVSLENGLCSSLDSLLRLLDSQNWAQCAKSLQLCLTLCDPFNCTLLGSSVQGVLQARILEWVAISSPRGSAQPRDQTHFSGVSCIRR